MQTFTIKKYENDINVSKKIKELIVKVLVNEHGFEEFKNDYMQKDYNEQNLHIWYIENQDKDVIASMLLEIDGKVGKLQGVCCEAEYRGNNLAQNLLNEVIIFCKNMNLEKLVFGTYHHLERAIGFYIKNGFTQVKEETENGKIAKFYELKIN